MAQMIVGAPNPPQRHIYREVNERIQRLVDDYQNNDIIGSLEYCLTICPNRHHEITYKKV